MNEASAATIPLDSVAIALDTNSLARGTLALDELHAFVDALNKHDLTDVEIWIPEPVLWEWAEHVYNQLAATFVIAKKTMKTIKASRLNVGPIFSSTPMIDVETILDSMESSLNLVERVEILRLEDYPEAAVAGLRDQVLQTGIGRRKTASQTNRIKTGASDSASFRIIESAAAGDLPRVVLVSGDRDAYEYFRNKNRPLIVGSLRSALRGVEKIPTKAQMVRELSHAIRSSLLEGDVEHLFKRSSMEREMKHFRDESDMDDQILSPDVSVSHVRSVNNIFEIEVSRGESFASATAQAKIDLIMEGVRWDGIDDELVHTWIERHDIEAELQVTALLTDMNIWSVSVEHIVIE